MTMHARVVSVILLALVIAPATIRTQGISSGPALAEPGISPDGREVSFVSGGDVTGVGEEEDRRAVL